MDYISQHIARLRHSHSDLRHSHTVRHATYTVFKPKTAIMRKKPNIPDEFTSMEEITAPYTRALRAFQKLETTRLVIRRVYMSDAAAMFAYSKDEDVARHVLWHAHQSLRQSKEYIQFLQVKYSKGKAASYGIIDKQSNMLIGTIGFMEIKPDSASADIGYSLHKSYWNKGIMTEALDAMLYYGFMELGLNRIEAVHEVDNPSSGRVLEKVGMQYEGVIRNKFFNKGKFVNVKQYAILFDDFIQRQKREDTHD